MNNGYKIKLALLILAMFGFVRGQPALATYYTITDVANISGGLSHGALSINNHGQIVGGRRFIPPFYGKMAYLLTLVEIQV